MLAEALDRGELVIGTRGSLLAVRQAEWVAARVREIWPECKVRLKRITTHGDRDRRSRIAQLGRVGVFTGELEQALRDGEIAVAVHSMKDLPSLPSAELLIAAVPGRADPRDALVSRSGECFTELPRGSVIGTGSLRRRSLIRRLRPDLTVVELRGNLDTRLAKVRDGSVECACLAAAGLRRLGREAEVSEYLDPELFIPAVGQGALAVQTRRDDHKLSAALSALNDPAAEAAVRAERAFLARLQGGCQAPIGAYAVSGAGGTTLRLCGFAATLDGARIVREQAEGPIDQPEALGREVADRALAAGAAEILDQARRESTRVPLHGRMEPRREDR